MQLCDFIHQKSYEKIMFQVRRSAITFVPALGGFALLLALPFALWFLLQNVWPELLTGPISFPLLVLLGSTYFLSVGVFLYTYFVTFYLDLLVVTNDRLMSIKQQGLFARTISELDLYKIQDITSEVKGVFATVFGYGKLTVQTAGASEEFVIEDIPHPEELRQAILDLAEEDRRHHNISTEQAQTGIPK